MSKGTREFPVCDVVRYEEISKKVDQLVIVPNINAKTYGYFKFVITDGIVQNNLYGGQFSCTAVGATYLVMLDRVKDDATGRPKPYTTMMITNQLSADTWSRLSNQIDIAIKETQAIIDA